MSVASGSHGPRLFRHGHIKLGIGLGYAIRLTSRHECLDPRDKIYEVLGFLKPEERNRVPASYSFSRLKVYTAAVEHMLQTTKSLNIICCPVLVLLVL